MSAAPTAHPTDETLRSYGAGQLDGTSLQAVSSHLRSCTDCQRRVAELSSASLAGRPWGTQNPPTARSGNPEASPPAGSETERLSADSLPSRVSSDTLPAEFLANSDYEIVRELGRGGMGVVYLVQNRLMGRPEAIKVMSPRLMERPAVLERFLREIRSVAKLRHPNVVTAYYATRLGES